MKVSLIVCLFFSLLLAGCSDSKEIEKQNLTSIKIDSVTESRFSYIKEFIETNDGLFIKVDYVDYLTGIEAYEAEKRDKAYYVIDGDTISSITDGYYISNVNPKIRTFKISKNAILENVIDNSGPHKNDP